MPWLTPDSGTWVQKCYRVSLPDNDTLRAAFRGAFLDLAKSENWELHGTATPSEVADSFLDCLGFVYEHEECESGGGGTMHVGQVFYYASETPPDGVLVCNGGLHNAADYPTLYALLGTRWGGSGVTFGVPDLRGRFLRSLADGLTLGYWDGEAEHTLTIDEIPSHNHTTPLAAGKVTTSQASNFYKPGTTIDRPSSFVGGGEAHNNLPPYHILVAMIQAE